MLHLFYESQCIFPVRQERQGVTFLAFLQTRTEHCIVLHTQNEKLLHYAFCDFIKKWDLVWKKMVKTWMLVKKKFSISLQSKAWSFFITHEHTFVHQSAGEPEIEMIQLQHWCDWLRYSPFYSATSIFAVFRNLVREIWFEKYGLRNLVQEKWLTRKKGGFIP